MNLNRLSLFALLGLTGLSVGTAQAAFITYTDEATFLSLLQPGYFQDKFNDVANGGDITNGGIEGDSSTRTGGGFSVTYTAPPAGLYSTAGGMSTAGVYDLVATLNGSNIYAVGGYFFLTDIDGIFRSFTGQSVTAVASNGSDPDKLLSVTVNSATNFFGWISTTPITTVTMTSAGRSPDRYNTLDNFIVGAEKDGSDPVPAPGTLALLALGGAGLIRRRKRVA